MVRNYAKDFACVVYDVSPSAAELAEKLGVAAVPTLSPLQSDVDTVILMLPNSRIVESILVEGGLLNELPKGSLIIDMGSSVPSSTQILSAEAAERSIDYVDAPVSGGVAKAITGELSVIVGGSPDAVARAMPHLGPLAAVITHVGPSGAGHAAKALNNLLSATNIAAAAEVISAAERLNIDPERMVAVLNASTGRSQASEVKYPKHILTGTFDSGFAMDLMLKDLAIAEDIITSLGISAPITKKAHAIAIAAGALLGDGPHDHTELVRWYESENDLHIRAGAHVQGADAEEPITNGDHS